LVDAFNLKKSVELASARISSIVCPIDLEKSQGLLVTFEQFRRFQNHPVEIFFHGFT